MKAAAFLLLVIIVLSGCANSTSDNEVIGIWRANINEKQLLEFGMKKEDIAESATEMKFSNNGVIEVRIIDPVNFIPGKVNQLVGVYEIENDRLKISFDNKRWENQKLVVDGEFMSLEAPENKGKIINQFTRINEWSLKI